MSYTKKEVIELMETLGMLYKYNSVNKTWNMQTHMAPGMLHETSDQIIDRFIDSKKRWEKHKKSIGL